jgi:hypothetical protein
MWDVNMKEKTRCRTLWPAVQVFRHSPVGCDMTLFKIMQREESEGTMHL